MAQRMALYSLAFLFFFIFTNGIEAKPSKGFNLPFPLCGTWVSEFSSFANEPKRATKEWQLPEASERKIKEIFNSESLSDLEKFEQAFDELWTAKIATAPAITRFLMKKPFQTLKNQSSIYGTVLSKLGSFKGGANYHPLFNRIANDQTMTSGAPEFLVLSHELGHAFHRNHSPLEMFGFIAFFQEVFNLIIPSVMLPQMLFRIESFAIGAQYEYIKRIPKSVRRALIRKQRDQLIKAAELSTSDEELLEAIDNSGLSTRLVEMYFDQRKVMSGQPEVLTRLADLIVFGIADQERLVRVDKLKKLAGSVKYGRDNADELYIVKTIEEILSNGLKNPKKLYAIWPELRDPMTIQKPLFKSGENKTLFRTYLKNQMAKLKGSTDYSIPENRYHQIFFQSLLHADLPKEKFIQKLRPYHGYDIENLNAGFNRFGPFRMLALTFLIFSIPEIAQTVSRGEILPYRVSISTDLNVIVQFFQYLFQ